MNRHSCPMPRARRRWRNALWICECGQAYRAVRADHDFADPEWRWAKWSGAAAVREEIAQRLTDEAMPDHTWTEGTAEFARQLHFLAAARLARSRTCSACGVAISNKPHSEEDESGLCLRCLHGSPR